MRNFNVAVKEWDDQVVFLHQIVPGAADKSYGIHVAQLAGVPRRVNDRAREVLAVARSAAPSRRRRWRLSRTQLRPSRPSHQRPRRSAHEPLANDALRRRGASAAR